MNKRLAVIAIVLVAVAAAAGLFATPSESAGNPPNCDWLFGCPVYLTSNGPSPTTLTMNALEHVRFHNADSVPHTVVFANGLCSLTVPAGTSERYQGAVCANPFSGYVGSYAYTVDGKFDGTVVTRPLTRSVSLTSRTHTIRPGTRLTLSGRVIRRDVGTAPPPPVLVLARHTSKQPFEPIATVRPKLLVRACHAGCPTAGPSQDRYGWKLVLRPDASTTYLAKVTVQRLCYFPASRCKHPHGQVWADPKSHPFTVRIQH